ncbi:MAG TPA: choice-of-anchor L domain-containing protein [Bacteroidia bacterium]|nr:choice-of-anchor L domain-containing protein [Bacteroidia bacterium]
MKKVLFTVALAVGMLQAKAQLNISTAMTPTQLVQNVLLGTGVTVSNVTYTGAAVSRGSFTCAGACNLGVSSGIYLSSGQINSLPNAPASMHHSTDVGQPGDAMLNAIVAPRLTQDAAVLEFDFSVAADSVQFRYVFGSEEYNDYANTNFNDVFAFFISGPGIVGTRNIALIPGTTTPVSINTVNNGGPVAGVATGPCMNCAYYHDNVGGASVFMDGFTTVLTAKSAVQPCQTYHIKLAVADVSDGIFDSGVFLEANSFSALGQIALFANGVAQQNAATVYACPGDSIQLCLNPAQNYSWTTGATSQCIWVSQQNVIPSHQYSGYVFGPPSCFAFTTTVNVQWVPPSATITPSGPTSLCPGSTVTLTANSGNSYLWSNGATSQSITVGVSGNYTVTVTNGVNCSAVSTPVQVTVGSAAASISGVLSICNGAATTLTANAGSTYLWSDGSTTQSINVSTSGTYSVTVTQAGGCTATASANVAVNLNPVPAISGTLNFCSGASTTLNAGAGYNTYSWNTGAITQNISVTTAGSYTVTVTSASGCSGSTAAAVVMNALPVPAVTGNLSICQGASSTLNGGAGFSSYSWNTGATTQTISASAAGSYTVTVTNAAGCSGSAAALLTVNALPVPNITGTFAFCQGASTTLNASPGYSGYLWNTGSTASSISISSANTFTVTVTDANGCTGSASQLSTVNPNPNPAISGNLSFCSGASTLLNAGAGYSSYNWSSGASTQNISVSAPGNYTVTVTNGFGCQGTTNIGVVMNPLPAPAITGTLSICQGASSTLNAGAGFSSYTWNTGATTQTISASAQGTYTVTVTSLAGCSNATSAALTVNALPVPAITGTFAVCQGTSATLNASPGYTGYQWSNGSTAATISVPTAATFTVTVTDANGCTGSASQLVTVNPNPVPAISGTLSFCSGSSTSISADPGYASYAWNTGATTQSLSVVAGGTYTVTVQSAAGCSGTVAAAVVMNPLPSPAVTGTMSICQGASSTLNGGAGFSSYVWNTGATTQTISTGVGGPYTVTVTNAFGCSGTAGATLTVNALPVPVITGVFAFCQGSSTTLNAGSGYSTYSWNTGSTASAITVSSGNTYTVTVTDANGCVGSGSQLVTANANPVPAVTGNTVFCQGLSSVMDAGSGYSGYLWSNGQSTQTISVSASGPYTVTVTDVNGCSGTAAVNITVNPNPVPSITGTMAFCQGDNSNLNAGAGYSSYNWSNGSTTQQINVTAGGTYTVTVSNAFGCTANTNAVVVVNALPVPSITGPSDICIGSTANYDAGSGFAGYLWSNGSTLQTISTSTAGTYSVTVTSAAGCTGSTSASLTVNPLPVPTITGVTAVCQGVNSLFDAGSGFSQYSWNTGATTQTISPGVAGVYTVVVTDANGCSNSTSLALTVNALPVPSISGTTAFCQGDNSDLTATSGFTGYLWSTGTTSSIINVTASGAYSVTVTDGNGCSGTTSVQITVNALPVPVISGNATVCDGTGSVFDAGSGYATYLWSDGSSGQTLPVAVAGSYSVTVTDLNGCTGYASQTLTVNPLPSASISGDAEICAGTNTTLTFNFNGTAPFTYSYYNGASGITPGPVSSSSTTVSVSPSLTTTYSLLTISDANCPGTVSGSALVQVNALPQPVISGDLSICDGESSELSATPGFVSYNWSNGASAPSQVTGTGGVYTVSVIDNNGCEGTSPAVTLAVHMVPVVSFTNDTSITCEVPAVNFHNTSQYDPGSYFAWTFGDGGLSTDNNPAHLYQNPGNYNVSLSITTPYGCSSSVVNPVSVVFFPFPVADFITSAGAVNVFNGKMQFVDRSSYAVSWLWEFGDGGTATTQNASHYFNEVGDFKVRLTIWNIAGCEDIHEEVITVNPFYIPNAFTPNGDGINDEFFQSALPYDMDVQSFDMVIFNRWGQQVFSGSSVKETWKGLNENGTKAPEGTYAYKIKVVTKGGKEHVFTGQVNLVR